MTFFRSTNYTDFSTDQTFHQFYDLHTEHDLYRIASGFHGAFVMGIACQQGKLTPGHFVPSYFFFCKCSNCRDKFFLLAMIFQNFHLEYTSVLDFAGSINVHELPTRYCSVCATAMMYLLLYILHIYYKKLMLEL